MTINFVSDLTKRNEKKRKMKIKKEKNLKPPFLFNNCGQL